MYMCVVPEAITGMREKGGAITGSRRLWFPEGDKGVIVTGRDESGCKR